MHTPPCLFLPPPRPPPPPLPLTPPPSPHTKGNKLAGDLLSAHRNPIKTAADVNQVLGLGEKSRMKATCLVLQGYLPQLKEARAEGAEVVAEFRQVCVGVGVGVGVYPTTHHTQYMHTMPNTHIYTITPTCTPPHHIHHPINTHHTIPTHTPCVQVWGAGNITADSWYYDHKCRSLEDVKNKVPNLTSQQVCGACFVGWCFLCCIVCCIVWCILCGVLCVWCIVWFIVWCIVCVVFCVWCSMYGLLQHLCS